MHEIIMLKNLCTGLKLMIATFVVLVGGLEIVKLHEWADVADAKAMQILCIFLGTVSIFMFAVVRFRLFVVVTKSLTKRIDKLQCVWDVMFVAIIWATIVSYVWYIVNRITELHAPETAAEVETVWLVYSTVVVGAIIFFALIVNPALKKAKKALDNSE